MTDDEFAGTSDDAKRLDEAYMRIDFLEKRLAEACVWHETCELCGLALCARCEVEKEQVYECVNAHKSHCLDCRGECDDCAEEARQDRRIAAAESRRDDYDCP